MNRIDKHPHDKHVVSLTRLIKKKNKKKTENTFKRKSLTAIL